MTKRVPAMKQGELFPLSPAPKDGWTDLDRLQAKVRRMDLAYERGELSSEQLEEYWALKKTLQERWVEAEAKWKKCFGR